MHQSLLNKIPTTASYQSKLQNLNFERIRKIVHKAEQRKLESVKQTFSFIKDIGQKDVQYYRGLHTELVDEINKMKEDNNTVYPVVVEETDEKFVEDKDNLFDN